MCVCVADRCMPSSGPCVYVNVTLLREALARIVTLILQSVTLHVMLHSHTVSSSSRLGAFRTTQARTHARTHAASVHPSLWPSCFARHLAALFSRLVNNRDDSFLDLQKSKHVHSWTAAVADRARCCHLHHLLLLLQVDPMFQALWVQ